MQAKSLKQNGLKKMFCEQLGLETTERNFWNTVLTEEERQLLEKFPDVRKEKQNNQKIKPLLCHTIIACVMKIIHE